MGTGCEKGGGPPARDRGGRVVGGGGPLQASTVPCHLRAWSARKQLRIGEGDLRDSGSCPPPRATPDRRPSLSRPEGGRSEGSRRIMTVSPAVTEVCCRRVFVFMVSSDLGCDLSDALGTTGDSQSCCTICGPHCPLGGRCLPFSADLGTHCSKAPGACGPSLLVTRVAELRLQSGGQSDGSLLCVTPQGNGSEGAQ